MKKPTTAELLAERLALTGVDAALANLVEQRGEAKICFDEEDGWFLQFLWHRQPDSWTTLDTDKSRHKSPTEAIKSAVDAHNEEVAMQRAKRLVAVHQEIAYNEA